MKRFCILLSLCVVVFVSAGRAQSDTAAFRSALSAGDGPGRVTAMVQFLARYPQSPFRGAAYNALFGLYLEQGNERQALEMAARSLETVPPAGRVNLYNQYAYSLATRNIGLDTALAYATRAEEMAQGGGTGTLGPIQDTRAFVLYRKGDIAGAEKLQREAIRGHDDDPEYTGHLAMYEEGTGKRRAALSTLARAIYLGGDRDMKARFDEWLGREEKAGRRRDALKDSVVMATVHGFIDTLRGEKSFEAMSTAAAFMAGMNVNLPAAATYAEEAVKSLTRMSPVENAVGFRQNLALVAAARGKFREALGMLREVEDLVSPWSTDFWLALGGIYEKLGQPEDAIRAFMNGLTATNPQELRDTLTSVYRKVHGSLDGLEEGIEKVRQSGASFDAGKYAPGAHETGKVILAELFTGAECGPCVAADAAFDALSEHYPSATVAILEYHVHIPGPDPLTTNDSWDRYRMYGARGTPTVVIDGRERIVGGGPKVIARNRFNLYRSTIEKYLGEEPGAKLTLDVSRRHDSVLVAARVSDAPGGASSGTQVLHVALVERSVDYIGGNGVSRQAMVVRKLFGGKDGTPLSPGVTGETVRLSCDVAGVEAGIRELLADPKGQPSWPGRTRNFGSWRARPEKIDRTNILIVAWIQDPVTNEVLQSASKSVPSGMSAN